MKAVALLGSPRKGGNTDVLASEVLLVCEEAGWEAEKLYLDDLDIRPVGPLVDDFDKRTDERSDDQWPVAMNRVLAADLLIWASPVYWQGVTAQMKALVDRFSTRYTDREFLRRMSKPWICITTHTAPDQGCWVLKPMRIWARHFKAPIIGELDVTVRAWGAVREMREVMEQARELGCRAVAHFAQ